jgi:hypothetical protein
LSPYPNESQLTRSCGAFLTRHATAAPHAERRRFGLAWAWSALRPAIEEFMLRPRPLSLLLCLSLAGAAAFSFCVFDIGFLLGTSPYWQAPRGLLGNSWADISTALSGYNYFVRDAWTLPLFQTSKLGAPDSVNIIFTDSIPIVAIFGRLLYRATGLLVNPYGVWTALCFVGSALGMTALVFMRGQRGLAAALTATASGLCMPALLQRWGHMSLMAQWEVVFALIIYFRSHSGRPTTNLAALALLLAVFALWTHSYLFVMVVGILAAALTQAVVDRRLGISRAVSTAALFAIALPGLVLISGHLSNKDSLAAVGFGGYSMNLISPFIPQLSGLFPAMREIIVDGTSGQYEGFSYFGAGILFLGFLALLRARRPALRAWQSHACLIGVLVAFTAFAVSNEIYVGTSHIVTIPLPEPILTIGSMFRSSGRFFWPCLYLLTAITIAVIPSLWGRAGCWLLLLAMVIQLLDTGPVRSALAARISEPAVMPLSETRWADAIRRHEFLRVVPPYGCLPERLPAEIAIELELLASRENVPTNTVYATRHQASCTSPAAGPLTREELQVYVLSDRQAKTPPTTVACATSATLAVCSGKLAPSDLAALAGLKP